MSRNKYVFASLLLTFGFLSLCLAQEEFVYDSQGKRNPFMPLISPDGRFLRLDKEDTKAKDDIMLEGIIYDKHGRSYAIMNSLVVGVGDFVEGYQLYKIDQEKVSLIKEGKVREVLLDKKEEE